MHRHNSIYILCTRHNVIQTQSIDTTIVWYRTKTQIQNIDTKAQGLAIKVFSYLSDFKAALAD